MNYEGLTIERLGHDCIKIKGSKTIYFDPYQVSGDLEWADIVLISHQHFDHCSPPDINKLADEKCTVVTVPDCQSKLTGMSFGNLKLIELGKTIEVDGVKIEAVPAYNVNKFRAPGVPFHPKENEWIGFIITMDEKRIYHAGDTDVIPEMKDFKDIDIAFLPVSGTYVMTALEAVDAVNMINPKLAIPMHYGTVVGTESDAELFKRRASCRVEII